MGKCHGMQHLKQNLWSIVFIRILAVKFQMKYNFEVLHVAVFKHSNRFEIADSENKKIFFIPKIIVHPKERPIPLNVHLQMHFYLKSSRFTEPIFLVAGFNEKSIFGKFVNCWHFHW